MILPVYIYGQSQRIRAKPNIKVSDTLAQNSQIPDTARNAIYLEVLGNSVLGCLNYERMIGESFSVRIGALFTATAMINYFIGSGSHKLEIGGGATFGYGYLGPTLTLGYRYQPKEGGFVFKAGFTPFDGVVPTFSSAGSGSNSTGIHPWVGISFGHCF